MLEVLELSLQLALGVALPLWIIRRDNRRAPAAVLQRSWNDASLWSAVVAFGPLSLLVHFARSRRSLSGFLLGLGWAALYVLTLTALSFVFSAFDK